METLEKLLNMAGPYLVAIIATFAASYGLIVLDKFFALIGKGIKWARDKGNENEYLENAKFDDWLWDRLEDVVLGVKGGAVDAMKLASEDGKLTPEEAKEVAQLALDSFISSLNKFELKEVLSVLGDDFTGVIKAKLPMVVEYLKPKQEIISTLEEIIEDPQ